VIAQGFCSHLLTIVAHCAGLLPVLRERLVATSLKQFLRSFNCLKLPEYLYTNACLQTNGLQDFVIRSFAI
jgi:hypothetical protein